MKGLRKSMTKRAFCVCWPMALSVSARAHVYPELRQATATYRQLWPLCAGMEQKAKICLVCMRLCVKARLSGENNHSIVIRNELLLCVCVCVP